MTNNPETPTELFDPLGFSYEGPRRCFPRDIFPYTLIPAAPGFKVARVKFADQDLVALKCIANDRVRLSNYYLKYFLEKANNVLNANGAGYHVTGFISPSFDFIITEVKNIVSSDATVFNSAKDTMLLLLSQYRADVATSDDYVNVESASLDPAVLNSYRAHYGEWLLFVPSTMEFIVLSNIAFAAMLTNRDGVVSDLLTELSYSISFTNEAGAALANCVPVDLSGRAFSIRSGLDCSFRLNPSTNYEVKAVRIDAETLVAEDGVYTIARVNSNKTVEVELAYGEFSLDISCTNCVVTGSPRRINTGDALSLNMAVLNSHYDVLSVNASGCEASVNESFTILSISNITGDSSVSVSAHEMADIILPSGSHFSAAAETGFTLHTKVFNDFKFKVTPTEGYSVSAVYAAPTGDAAPSLHRVALLADAYGVYTFTVFGPTTLTAEVVEEV